MGKVAVCSWHKTSSQSFTGSAARSLPVKRISEVKYDDIIVKYHSQYYDRVVLVIQPLYIIRATYMGGGGTTIAVHLVGVTCKSGEQSGVHKCCLRSHIRHNWEKKRNLGQLSSMQRVRRKWHGQGWVVFVRVPGASMKISTFSIVISTFSIGVYL